MRWNVSGLIRRLSIVLVAWLAIALPAIAVEVAVTQPATESGGHGLASLPPPKIEVTTPTILAVGSSIDEPTLRAIFSGGLADLAAELAALHATSIRIPELRIGYTTPAIDGTAQSGEIVLRDLRLNKVSKGIAQAIILGSVESTTSAGGTTKFGRTSAEDFDIGGLLAFFGVVKADPAATTPKTIYRNLLMTGGTLIGPQAKCTVGSASVARVALRPPKISFPDVLALATKTAGGPPSPEAMATFVDFYADLMQAIETSPARYAGFDCAGTDDAGKAIAVKVGPLTIGAFAHARYPEIVAKGLKIAAEGDGDISLGEFRFKGFDFAPVLAALKSAGNGLTDAWFEQHYREVIPAFDGVAFSKLSIDVPDQNNPGQRVKGSVASFDLTLKGYVNGVPTDVSTMASHVVALLPKDSSDTSVQQLLSLGIDKFDVGYDVAVKWDEASGEIRLGRFSLTGVNMGSIGVASIVGQATRDLFATDLGVALGAATGLTLKRVKINMKDSGLANIILTSAAKEAGKGVTEFRQAFAGVTQATMLIFLGGAADVNKVTKAVGDFINGAKTLSVTVTAKDPAGVSFSELETLKDDPTGLADKVNIDAIAK